MGSQQELTAADSDRKMNTPQNSARSLTLTRSRGSLNNTHRGGTAGCPPSIGASPMLCRSLVARCAPGSAASGHRPMSTRSYADQQQAGSTALPRPAREGAAGQSSQVGDGRLHHGASISCDVLPLLPNDGTNSGRPLEESISGRTGCACFLNKSSPGTFRRCLHDLHEALPRAPMRKRRRLKGFPVASQALPWLTRLPKSRHTVASHFHKRDTATISLQAPPWLARFREPNPPTAGACSTPARTATGARAGGGDFDELDQIEIEGSDRAQDIGGEFLSGFSLGSEVVQRSVATTRYWAFGFLVRARRAIWRLVGPPLANRSPRTIRRSGCRGDSTPYATRSTECAALHAARGRDRRAELPNHRRQLFSQRTAAKIMLPLPVRASRYASSSLHVNLSRTGIPGP